jgi:amino acid adenylation domain-containing protein
MRPRYIHSTVEEQAARTPDAVAVEEGSRILTYQELERRSNRLAHRLRALGVRPERLVVVCLEASAALAVAALAIWKAGGVYVPLDPSLPEARRSLILADSAAGLVLDAERLAREEEVAADEPSDAPEVLLEPGNLAYLIYTSGSTGRPKGVELEHRGIVNLVDAHLEHSGVGPGVRVLWFSSPGFDASISELVMSLGTGATLCVEPREKMLGAALAEVLRRRRIDCLTIPPSLLAELPAGDFPDLQVVISAGEVCGPELVERWAPGRRFFNHYGPTEGTVWTTVARCLPGRQPRIGAPIAHVEVHLLDPSLQPVPDGTVGEICIGGIGVARGYRNLPSVTSERFVESRHGRLFRSGDLARQGEGGQLEYLGRRDRQLKVRGVRVAPEEIESTLRTHPAVRNAAVAARPDGRLAAWVVLAAEATTTELRRHLELRLPAPMVPSWIKSLAALPVGPNGKLDHAALPAPEPSGQDEASADAAPAARLFAEVLGMGAVKEDDHFFELGGHSLLAMRLLMRVQAEQGREIGLAQFLEEPTPRGLARALIHAGVGATPRPAPAGPVALTGPQRAIWLTEQKEPGLAVYNAPLLLRFGGPGGDDVEALLAACSTLFARHAILCTRLVGEPPQLIPGAPPVVDRVDLRGRQGELGAAVAEEARRSFDLTGPLLRARLFQLGDSSMALLVVIHHLVFDGWSAGVFSRELVALYDAFSAGRSSPLADATLQYRDWAAWGAGRNQSAQLLSWWRERLSGAPALELPVDRAPPGRRTRPGLRLPVELPPSVWQPLLAFGRRERCTPFGVALALFQTLLTRYTGQVDLVIASPLANRPLAGQADQIGCFVNTVLLRGDLSGGPTMRSLFRRSREQVLGAWAYGEAPLVQVLEQSGNPGISPRAMLLFEAPLPEELPTERQPWTARIEEPHNGSAVFDLTLAFRERGGGLRGHLEYDTDLFDRRTAMELTERWQQLAAAAAVGPDTPIDELPFAFDSERRLIASWNRTQPGESEPVHRRLAGAAGDIALESGSERLTYAQLAEWANRVAALVGAGGGRVGIALERSAEMAVAVLGVLSAGASCLPLDPGLPKERLELIVAEAQPRLTLDRESVRAARGAAPAAAVSPDDEAYVMYTSGSTGRPKGVVVPHRVLANLIGWHLRVLGGGRRTLQLAPLSFDVSFYELFTTWAAGGAVVVGADEARRDPRALAALIDEARIEKLIVPPLLLEALAAEVAADSTRLTSLEQVIATGDRLRITPEVTALFDRLPHATLHNHYGPTETHVVTAYTLAGRPSTWPALPPIGRPIDNAQAWVLDDHGEVVPPGVAGELHLGGVCVADGYLGRPAETNRRFVANRFSAGRLYRSGDIARWSRDGQLEFLGRRDHQVKISGHRIELGEIETVLLRHPRVEQAAVVVEAGQLQAWLVCSVEDELLRAHLARTLPAYMIPTRFLRAASLPRSANGKLDRAALARLMPAEPHWVAPRTAVERGIAEIWSTLLKRPTIGAFDNFFDIGGHSLTATQAALRISRAFAIKLPARRIFEEPTLAGLATVVERLIHENRVE